MNSSPTEIEALLANAQDPENYAKLFALVYSELRRMAGRYCKNEWDKPSLQPTSLVHELYCRLTHNGPDHYESRAHFFGIAARAMRQILVERGRANGSQKRGGGWQQIPLESVTMTTTESIDYVALDEALSALARVNELQCRIVELRVFGGLDSDEIAALLEMAASTVRSHWAKGKAWLEEQLAGTERKTRKSVKGAHAEQPHHQRVEELRPRSQFARKSGSSRS